MPRKPGKFFRGSTRTLRPIFAILAADCAKLKHDPSQIVVRILQPLLWILIAAGFLKKSHFFSKDMAFLISSILPMSLLLAAIFRGVSLIAEKNMGSLQKILITPSPRILFILGRTLSTGIQGLIQVIAVYVLALLIQANVHFSFGSFIIVCLVSLLFGALFAALSIVLASLIKKRESFLAIVQMVLMPLFFASNALYPIENAPSWTRTLSLINPLSYQIDATRTLVLENQPAFMGLAADLSYGLGLYIILCFIASKLQPRIIY